MEQSLEVFAESCSNLRKLVTSIKERMTEVVDEAIGGQVVIVVDDVPDNAAAETNFSSIGGLASALVSGLGNLASSLGSFSNEAWDSSLRYYELIKEIGVANFAAGVGISIKAYFREWAIDFFEIRNSVRMVGGKYAISYETTGREYIMLVNKPSKRTINKVISVTCGLESQLDVTEEFRKWYGPYYDFHGLQITPKDMGFNESICIELNGCGFDDKIVKFELDEVVKW